MRALAMRAREQEARRTKKSTRKGYCDSAVKHPQKTYFYLGRQVCHVHPPVRDGFFRKKKMDLGAGHLPTFRRQLRVLGYTDELDIYSLSSVKGLVVWLEDKCFRQLSEEGERSKLVSQVGDEWASDAMHEYLETLGSPFSFGRLLSDVQRATVVEWMLNYAVSLRYAQHADEFNDGAAVRALSDALRDALEKNGSGGGLASEARDLALQLGLPEASSQVQARQMVLACLRHAARLLRRAREPNEAPAAAARRARPAEAAWLDVRPDDLEGLLRVLYLEDASELERRAATLLVLLQNITAAPVVDASLGKGGR